MFDDVSCSHIWLSGRRQWLHPRRSDITSAGEFTESPGSPVDPTPVSLSTVLLASAILGFPLGFIPNTFLWLHVELLHGARSPKYLRRLGSDTVNLTKLVRYFYMTNTFYHKIQTCSVYNNNLDKICTIFRFRCSAVPLYTWITSSGTALHKNL